MSYNYLIVGAGPTGLTLAWILAKYGYKSLIIEREREIGGCHRVRRVNNLFVEHGPRIYYGGSSSFTQILKEMGTSWDAIFTPYKYSFSSEAIPLITSTGTLKDLFWLAAIQVGLFWNNNYGRDESMLHYMDRHNFSEPTQDIVDSYCRLTDGAGADRYTVFQFSQLMNQHMFYQNFEPRLPNDKGLFKVWARALAQTDLVDIWLDTEIINLNESPKGQPGIITSATVMREGYLVQIRADNYILAIPPQNFVQVLSNSASTNIKNAFGPLPELKKWEKESRYIVYIPIVYHWDEKLDLEKPWTHPVGPWKVGFMVMSDYIAFSEPESRTVITTVISQTDVVLPGLGKTANQATEEELKMAVLGILENHYGKLPPPAAMIMSPGVTRAGKHDQERWETRDTAFVLTESGFVDQKSNLVMNLYNVGPHNGYSKYDFTSIEAAVSNAFALIHKIVPEDPKNPELNPKKVYEIKRPVTFNRIAWDITTVIAVLIVVMIVWTVIKPYTKGIFTMKGGSQMAQRAQQVPRPIPSK